MAGEKKIKEKNITNIIIYRLKMKEDYDIACSLVVYMQKLLENADILSLSYNL